MGYDRFIPTPVGNTDTPPPPPPPASVHPHACGEHANTGYEPVLGLGSSPRLWGTRDRCPTSPVVERFIPTPVGNTTPMARLRGNMAVHPHACGEHSLVPKLISWASVHPHACGEHNNSVGPIIMICGSSPRLWGTPVRLPSQPSAIRFIPTPVGNTISSPRTPPARAVHPHACGEHVSKKTKRSTIFGSSPRLWGTQHDRRRRGSGYRFIPTPVGNTRAVAASGERIPVHPHACGEHC